MGQPKCWAYVQMPPEMAKEAAALLPREFELVDDHLQCLRDAQHDDEHHAALDGIDDRRSLFVRWNDDRTELVALDDCTSTSPDQMDGCSLYDGHTEPHTWEYG